MPETSANIGILGLGGRTTLFYLDYLNSSYKKSHSVYSTFPMIILNADFNHINPFLPDKFEELKAVMSVYLKKLEHLGISHLIIPNITLHETVDQISDKIPASISIIHPLEELLDRLEENGCRNILLMGSAYTMKSSYIKNHLKSNGIDIHLPPEAEQEQLDEIRRKIYRQLELSSDIDLIEDLIEKYSRSFDAVVVCCTELSIASAHLESASLIDLSKLQMGKALLLSGQYESYADSDQNRM